MGTASLSGTEASHSHPGLRLPALSYSISPPNRHIDRSLPHLSELHRTSRMKTTITAMLLLGASVALAQQPQRPLIPLNTWSLTDYHAVDVSEAFKLPEGLVFDSIASVDMTADNHLLVLNRGAKPFLEFAEDGTLVRAFGDEGVFSRAHGLRIDKDGNMWVADVGAHFVRKYDKDGNTLMTIGTPGTAGEWDEASGAHLLNQPNETAIDSAGNLYIVSGHGAVEPRVLKFSPDGK